MLGVRRMFESLLKMNKRTGSLDQAFEKIVVTRVGVQPNLLKHIVRFVVLLFVPAMEVCDVIRMIRTFR